MFIGGCGGSTSGGLKVTRIILLFKSMTAVLRRKLHPRAVIQTRAGGENFSESMLLEVFCFFSSIRCPFFMDHPYRRKRRGYSFRPGPFHCHHEQLGAGTGTIRRHLQLVGHACHDKMVVALSMLMGRLESFTLLILSSPLSGEKRMVRQNGYFSRPKSVRKYPFSHARKTSRGLWGSGTTSLYIFANVGEHLLKRGAEAT